MMWLSCIEEKAKTKNMLCSTLLGIRVVVDIVSEYLPTVLYTFSSLSSPKVEDKYRRKRRSTCVCCSSFIVYIVFVFVLLHEYYW
jgi:hypothetical protein